MDDTRVTAPPYAELHAISNFSFLRGASHPEELVARAAALGYQALALTDECSFAGTVRAHAAAKRHELKLVIGSELTLDCGLRLVLLATDRAGYARLSRLISEARLAAPKGRYHATRSMLADGMPGCLEDERAEADGRWLAACFGERCRIAVERWLGPDEGRRLAGLAHLSAHTGIARVAAGDVRMHVRGRRALADTLTAIRLGTTVADAGDALAPNGECHLRRREHLAGLYPRALLDETVRLAQRCSFSLEAIRGLDAGGVAARAGASRRRRALARRHAGRSRRAARARARAGRRARLWRVFPDRA